MRFQPYKLLTKKTSHWLPHEIFYKKITKAYFNISTFKLAEKQGKFIQIVEVEGAHHYYLGCSAEERKKYKTFWYRKIFYLGFWRCPEAGSAHLE